MRVLFTLPSVMPNSSVIMTVDRLESVAAHSNKNVLIMKDIL